MSCRGCCKKRKHGATITPIIRCALMRKERRTTTRTRLLVHLNVARCSSGRHVDVYRARTLPTGTKWAVQPRFVRLYVTERLPTSHFVVRQPPSILIRDVRWFLPRVASPGEPCKGGIGCSFDSDRQTLNAWSHFGARAWGEVIILIRAIEMRNIHRLFFSRNNWCF